MRIWIVLAALVSWLGIAAAQALPEAQQRAIDKAVEEVLAATKTPSASIAIVKGNQVAYARAYGEARLEPKTPATPEMRYKIGSNSKQFIATATLLLAEQGKLSLDEKVSKYLPTLTRANEITIRQLLSHTAGYEDYYPLDYVTPEMARPKTPLQILDGWAKKPLNFDPGTRWQYSNTGFIAAGLILEKVAGMPLYQFLKTRLFEPLGMKTVIDADKEKWSDADPMGYTIFALGPPRPVAPEGQGWLFSAGQLAMTPADLARWNISLMKCTLLKPASLKTLTTEVMLANGSGSGYALGIGVSNRNGQRRWSHGGGTAGFISANFSFPDDGVAVTVLTNLDSPAAPQIGARLEAIVLAKADDKGDAGALALAKKVFAELQRGELDRSQLTADANAYFTAQALADYSASLKPLGDPSEFRQAGMQLRGGMEHRTFAVRTASRRLSLNVYMTTDGKIAQFLVSPVAGQ